MGRVRWDIYLVILRAMAMFIMAAHGLYFISRAADAAADQLLRSGPNAVAAVFNDPSRL